MLVLGVLAVLEALANAVMGLIPSPSVPGINALATSVVSDGWFQHLGWANNYLPLSETLSALGIVMTVWVGMWVIRLLLWLFNKFHLTGGEG